MVGKTRNRRWRSARGVALVETAICLPVVLIFFLGMLEISQMQDFQQRATSVLVEALRNASAVSGLSSNNDANGPIFVSLRSKDDMLLEKYRLSSAEGIKYSYSANSDGDGGVLNAHLIVNVPRNSLSGVFYRSQIRVTGSAPYLYTTNQGM